jgi:hypothetical protein
MLIAVPEWTGFVRSPAGFEEMEMQEELTRTETALRGAERSSVAESLPPAMTADLKPKPSVSLFDFEVVPPGEFRRVDHGW